MAAIEDGQAAETAPPAQVAAGSSFYLAMRILPRAQRQAMYAVYGFCRAVDDIADGDLPQEAKLRALQGWRDAVTAMAEGREPPAELAIFAGEGRRFQLRRQDFLDVIDGMEMDANGPIRAPDEATLDLYCDRVASAVGRLSNRIFGLADRPGEGLAHHLGRALQLTNILRDLDEDADLGRLYLPRGALAGAGIDAESLSISQILAHPALDSACRVVARRAEDHFVEADRIMDASPRHQVKAPRLMAAAYGDILARLQTTGWTSPRRRLSMSKPRLLLALLRYGIV